MSVLSSDGLDSLLLLLLLLLSFATFLLLQLFPHQQELLVRPTHGADGDWVCGPSVLKSGGRRQLKRRRGWNCRPHALCLTPAAGEGEETTQDTSLWDTRRGNESGEWNTCVSSSSG